jgi:hypothetical protein
MGLDPKGRAFYWRTPSRSNAPFLKRDADLAPKLRAFRSARFHFSKAARSATMRGRPTAPAHPKNHPALVQ